MTEEQMLQAMLDDAKQVRKRYRNKWGGKAEPKIKESKPEPQKTKEPAAPTKSGGWRKISDKEIDDILYFQSKGWCVTSTAIFLGVSKSTVKRYREKQS